MDVKKNQKKTCFVAAPQPKAHLILLSLWDWGGCGHGSLVRRRRLPAAVLGRSHGEEMGVETQHALGSRHVVDDFGPISGGRANSHHHSLSFFHVLSTEVRAEWSYAFARIRESDLSYSKGANNKTGQKHGPRVLKTLTKSIFSNQLSLRQKENDRHSLHQVIDGVLTTTPTRV